MNLHTMFDLEGQVAFVTGAASGIGLAYAEVLAEAGAHVVMADIDDATLHSEVHRLSGTSRVPPEAAVLDVGDCSGLAAVIDDTVKRYGRLDIAFANAGVSAGQGFALATGGELANLDTERWDQVLRTNLTATMNTLRLASRPMKAARSGRMIVTASIAGIRAEPLVGYAYAATKAAVVNLVRQAATELAPYNVLVNAIAPGPFLTNIAGGQLKRNPSVVAKFGAMVPMGRIGEPDEIKGLALLLASPAGSFITGAVIPIDGGVTAAV